MIQKILNIRVQVVTLITTVSFFLFTNDSNLDLFASCGLSILVFLLTQYFKYVYENQTRKSVSLFLLIFVLLLAFTPICLQILVGNEIITIAQKTIIIDSFYSGTLIYIFFMIIMFWTKADESLGLYDFIKKRLTSKNSV